uniref:Transcriptional adapter n=1 Tax=Peronospora matthiolae TaxID=2874970 RepID=A0AAV1UDN3_9STRA
MAGRSESVRRSHKSGKAKTANGATADDTSELKLPSKSPGSTSDAPLPAKQAAMKTKFCLNCQKDLARNIRITCAECHTKPLIDLCVECFAVGVELGEHKKTHKYTVSDCLAFPVVYEPPTSIESMSAASIAVGTNAAALLTAAGNDTASAVWTADEELLLLEGIEMFGMGNWKDIAEHVVTKSEKKCERHYLTAYLGWKDLMPRFVGDAIDEGKEEVGENAAEDKLQLTTEEKAIEMNAASDQATRGSSGERNVPSQLAGYMPLRGDFDVEYDNEAEVVLADMEFSDTDHPAERELKLKVIQIYNQKLEKRMERKKFVVGRGLLDYKLHQHTERKRPKEERELLAQVRPFARFQTPEEHDKFVEGLITAMRLKKQIMLLQEYRKNGVRTLAEAELYDADKKKRELDQAIQKQRDSAAYLYESGRTTSSRDRASRWHNREQIVNGDASGDSSRNRASGVGGLEVIATDFSIEGTPGSHLLTSKEKEVCRKLKLLPKHYLVIKDALVRECYRLGYLTKKMAKEMVQIDANKTSQVYDFFVKCGWVKTESAITTVSPSLKSVNLKSPKESKTSVENAKVELPAKRKASEMEADTKM